jgi:hypothetical protein
VRGCLFTLLLGAIVIGFVIVVGLPAAAAGILTAGLSTAGLVADDTTVTVTSDPPTDVLGLRADSVRVTATDATFRGLEIGALDLALGDVQVLERTAGSVDGQLTDVTLTGAGGHRITVERIALLGGPDGITTTTVIPSGEVRSLIADAVEAQTGSRPTSVTLRAPDGVSFTLGGARVAGRFAATADGDLVVRGDEGLTQGREVVLVRGGDDLPIKLTSVKVTPSGDLRLTGDLTIGILG